MAIDLPIEESQRPQPTFEELYENFIVDKYGANFFKYALFLNSSLILFIVCISMFYLSDKWRHLYRAEAIKERISPIMDFEMALKKRARARRV